MQSKILDIDSHTVDVVVWDVEPDDEIPIVGSLVTITDCGAHAFGDDRFKWVCTCPNECRSGWRPTIRYVDVRKDEFLATGI